MPGRMPQQIAAAFALCAFAVSIATGLLTSVEPVTVLLRSVVVLIGAGAIGRVLGGMALVAMNEHLTTTTANNPVPERIRIRRPPAPGGLGDVELIEDVERP